jgi:hypothetical protein
MLTPPTEMGLWQQDIPATPEHPAAVFEKGFQKLFNQHFRKGLYIRRGSV